MPNIKSAKKRVLIAELRHDKNAAYKSKVKTVVKNFNDSVEVGNKEAAQAKLLQAVSVLDKTAGRGIIHKKAASRKKSQIYQKFNQM